MAEENELLKIEDVAARLKCNRRAVERLIEARKIPVIRLNKRVLRFRWPDVQTALAKLTVRAL